MLDPQPTALGWGSNLCPGAPKMLLIPLGYSGNTNKNFFNAKKEEKKKKALVFYGLAFAVCKAFESLSTILKMSNRNLALSVENSKQAGVNPAGGGRAEFRITSTHHSL